MPAPTITNVMPIAASARNELWIAMLRKLVLDAKSGKTIEPKISISTSTIHAPPRWMKPAATMIAA